MNCHRLSRCTSGEKFKLLTWKVSVFGIFLVSIFLQLSEYLDLQSKSPYSVWMRENMNQKNSEYGHFYTVLSICRYWDLTVMKGVTQLLFYINHKELRGRFFKTYLFFLILRVFKFHERKGFCQCFENRVLIILLSSISILLYWLALALPPKFLTVNNENLSLLSFKIRYWAMGQKHALVLVNWNLLVPNHQFVL